MQAKLPTFLKVLTRKLSLGALLLAVLAAMLPDGGTPGWVRSAHADPAFVDGSSSQCEQWMVGINLLLTTLSVQSIAEEGWVYRNGLGTTDRYRDASGVVTKSKVAHNDTPGNHYSHDWNADIRVDPGQQAVLSNVNHPNDQNWVASPEDFVPATSIEMEWELGITPGETTGDGADPILPRWVLPNLGDRLWTNGHWVFDCGHGKKVGGHYVEVQGIQVLVDYVNYFRTEIHPARAIASMRSQAATLPGSGTTPVPVTATDLYIHGRGGFIVQQLKCGIDIILDDLTSDCAPETAPIDDLFSFDICLPPKPAPSATLASRVVVGPGDSGKGGTPGIQAVAASAGCKLPPDEFGNAFDHGQMHRVTADLRGTGILPTDTYARQIVSGWVYPELTPLPHLSLSLNRLDLHADLEFDPFDAEMTFWWMGVNRAPNDEWHRLVNSEIPTYDDAGAACFAHTNTLNDIDDDDLCGNGLLNFSGPTWDFYLRHAQSFTVQTTGFEQDCLDGYFGSKKFELSTYILCYGAHIFFELGNDHGNNDPIEPMNAPVGGSGIDLDTLLGELTLGVPGNYDFRFSLEKVALVDEDNADLAVAKHCTFVSEVALAGQPFTCTIAVTNTGPGLPRNVVVTDALSSTLPASAYSVGPATYKVGADPTAYSCGATSSSGFSCNVGTVPVGGSVAISVQVTPSRAGTFRNLATVSTWSTDLNPTNNSSRDSVLVYLPVTVDIQPGNALNSVNTTKRGVISVAILTDSGFNAAAVTVATACFGEADVPAERNCAEAHGGPHLGDVDKDQDPDLLFHFEVFATGIDFGDARACLRGTFTDGTGFYGCDAIRTVK